MKFDIDKIKEAGYKLTTPIIAAGVSDKKRVKVLAGNMVDIGQKLFEIK